MASQLYGVRTWDPGGMVIMAAVLGTATFLAAVIPAKCAASVERSGRCEWSEMKCLREASPHTEFNSEIDSAYPIEERKDQAIFLGNQESMSASAIMRSLNFYYRYEGRLKYSDVPT